jgi:hypothetical protein
MGTITINLADATAADLARQAKRLGISVDELVEAMAGQFLSDRGVVFDLTDAQIAQIRRNLNDPAPSIAHDEVIAEIDRVLAAKK